MNMRLRHYVVIQMETGKHIIQSTTEFNWTQILLQDTETNGKLRASERIDSQYVNPEYPFQKESGFLENLLKTIRNYLPTVVAVKRRDKTTYFIAQIWRAGRPGVEYGSSPAFSFTVVNNEARTVAELLFEVPVELNEIGIYANPTNTIEVYVQGYN